MTEPDAGRAVKKILVVDDDEDMVAFVVLLLSHNKQYEVLSASNGKEGCELARQAKPDLVILDLMMPDMHGFEVCKILREDAGLKNVKIIVASGKRYDTDRKGALSLGADMFLPKPYSADALRQAVSKLLAQP